MLKILGRESEVALEPVSSEYFSVEYFAPRPASERLVNTKLDLLGINEMSDWRVSLSDYLITHYSHLIARNEEN